MVSYSALVLSAPSDAVDVDDDEVFSTRMSCAKPPLISESTKKVLSQKWNSLLDLLQILALTPTKSSFGFVKNSIWEKESASAFRFH